MNWWRLAIKNFKGSSMNGRVVVCVVPPFSQRLPFIPMTWFIRSHTSRVGFQKLVYHLSLTIILRMVSRGEDLCRATPWSLKDSCQNLLRKMGSLSLVIDSG